MFIVNLTVVTAGIGEVQIMCQSEANAWIVFNSCIFNFAYSKGSIVINGKQLANF